MSREAIKRATEAAESMVTPGELENRRLYDEGIANQKRATEQYKANLDLSREMADDYGATYTGMPPTNGKGGKRRRKSRKSRKSRRRRSRRYRRK